MKTWESLRSHWGVQQRRIDALSLRERVFLFLGGAALLLALTDLLFISPQQESLKQLGRSQQQQFEALKLMRVQLASVSGEPGAHTPGKAVQQELREAQQRVQGLQAQLRHHKDDANMGQSDLHRVIETLLKRHERLQLHKLESLAKSNTASPLADRPAAPGSDAALSWQGVEVQLTGSYQDLLSYVRDLERALPQVRWGELRVDAPDPALALPSHAGSSRAQTTRLQLQIFVRAS